MWKKIFAARKLKGKQLEIVKQLAAWRERTARQTNRPRKWVIPDHALIDMAKRHPENKTELSLNPETEFKWFKATLKFNKAKN